jgi:hypothetical protein
LAEREEELQKAYLDLFTSDANSDEAKNAAKVIGDTSLGQIGINQISDENNKLYQLALKGLQASGYNWTATTDNAVRGNDNNRRFVFVDETGK